MSSSGVPSLDTSIQKVNEWVKEFSDEVGALGKQQAFRGLAVGLQASFACGVVRASGGSLLFQAIRKQSEYLRTVADSLTNVRLALRAEEVAQGVFRILDRHITPGKVEKVRHALPEPFESFGLMPLNISISSLGVSIGAASRVTADRSLAAD